MNQIVLDRRHRELPTSHADENVVIHIDSLSDAGRLLLRLLVGVLLLLHGVAKLRGGVSPIMGMLAHADLPPWLAYGAYLGEVVAPLLLIAGVWVRPAALVAALNMVVALALVHTGDLARLGPQGGYALELQAFYLFGAIAILLLGSGRFGLARSGTYWN